MESTPRLTTLPAPDPVRPGDPGREPDPIPPQPIPREPDPIPPAAAGAATRAAPGTAAAEHRASAASLTRDIP